VIRRQFIGTYLDSDAIAYDPQGGGLRLEDLATGVTQIVGGTHNTLIVEMDKYLVAFDAPYSEGFAKWTMEQEAKKYPGKPFKYVVLTHHHMDHASGVRTFAAAGATVVVGKGDREHFIKVLTSPDTLGRDAPKNKFTPDVVEVATRYVITDGKRDVYAYLIDNPHVEGMLIGYVPDAKLGWVTDLWSPGRDPLPAKPTPGLTAVVAGVKKWGLEPERFAAGHGSSGPYEPLAKLVASTQ
jgi:glyoxylase-like metal-dependent hydrolase (beta-lactamase superfamily II)